MLNELCRRSIAHRLGITALVLAASFSRLAPADSAGDANAAINFDRQIRPILSNACFTCHGPDSARREADLRLDLEQHAKQSVIVPGDPDGSELIRRVTSHDPDQLMPPPDKTQRPSEADIRLLRRWIAQGAPWDKHWAYTAPKREPLPKVARVDWPRVGIDHFVLARLEKEQLQPTIRATRPALIRRVSLDLTGLPPTLAEIDAFVADESPDALQRVVDRLLASPRYGEHMAQAWLAAARYADTNGYQHDATRTMWPWRDWVVRSMNDNMPFDKFTLYQLAGDLLENPTQDQLIATGFHRNHGLNGEGGRDPEESRVEYVVDRASTTGSVWLGLTVGCARCHDHKYDQITQKEFYQFYAYFNQVDERGGVDAGGNAKPVLALSTDEKLAETKKLQTMVMRDRKQPRDTYLLKRGFWNNPDKSEKLYPSTPACLPLLPEGAAKNRLALAQWLIRPDHPLTARVTVNRIWQHFFGMGLVRTSEDFGVQGERPVHPKLLDWLALEFIDSGWDVKALHKLIVMSATYQQTSTAPAELIAKDPYNRLLARGPRFRLSAQAIRDQALAVSGLLVEKRGGPGVLPYQPPGVWSDFSLGKIKYKQGQGEDLYRRSIYTFWRRPVGPTVLFDNPGRQVCTVRPALTNTPLHALTLLNDTTYIEAARALAERILKSDMKSPNERITHAFRITTARQPSEAELASLADGLGAFIEHYQSDPQAAGKLIRIGESKPDEQLDVIELAAYTSLMNVILNLDEVQTKG